MGDVVGDVVGFVEDAADVVVDVVETVTEPVSNVVETVVSPIAEAVSAIPVVGDVVGMAAPFGGMIGTLVGGPLGGAIGNAVGDSFGDGGGGFDFLDTAIGMFGGDLPGPLADIAGNLLDGGSLIDSATSVFGGDLGGIAQNLLGGEFGGIAQNILGGNMPDLGDLGGIAGQVFGGEGGPLSDLGGFGDIAENILGGNMPDLGDLGGIAGQVLGDNMPDLGPFGGIVGQVLGGGGEMPDLGDIGGLGGLIKTADSVFGGLGLGNLGSAASGIVGDCMPDLSGPGGWLGNLPNSLPGIGQGDGGFDLPFGMGSFPSIPDIAGPITQGGGGWLDIIKDQSEMITDCFPNPIFQTVEDFNPLISLPHLPFPDISPTVMPPIEVPDLTDLSTLPDTDLDDLVFNLPGVDRDGAARDALQQLADAGNLGEALASLSQDDLTTLVTRLVAPTASPAIDTIVDNAATSGQALDDLGLPASVTGDLTQQPADDFGDDLVTVGADAGLGGPDTAGAVGDGAAGEQSATSGLAGQDAQMGAQDDLGLGLDAGVDAGVAQPEPAQMETFTPEPEPQSDFSQQIAQADAVEDSFDSMFDDLGGTGQG